MFEFIKRLFNKQKIVLKKVEDSSTEDDTALSREEFLSLKRKAKQQAKSMVKTKFIVGKWYYFKSKQYPYELKKFVYTVNRQIVNKVIVKPLFDNTEFNETLNSIDCKKYHIKYEPGLVVLSMNLNWRQI